MTANHSIKLTEVEIIEQILKGETPLYELIVRRYNPYLYKIGRSYNYNHEDTQDLMQDTYVDAFKNLAQFEQRANFKTWLARIMLNNCYKKREKMSFKNEYAADNINENLIPMFSNTKNDTHTIIQSKELGHIIENALEQVPEIYRIVFSLREINGMSVAETAEILDISEANVKVRLNRSKEMLKALLEKKYSATELYEFNLIYCDAMVERVMSEIKKPFAMKEITNDNIFRSFSNSPDKNATSESDDEERIKNIALHFEKIMQILGLDLTDDSLKDTPARVAKMYVRETFSGLNEQNKPTISLFENKYVYKKMLIEKNITLYSNCEHHFVPIIGRVHIAYIPNQKVIGLSKLNRLVQFYAKRPQVQERLTIQIAEALKDIFKHNDIAVVIEADHLCVASRGIRDTNSLTVTSHFSGQFENEGTKQEFLSYIKN